MRETEDGRNLRDVSQGDRASSQWCLGSVSRSFGQRGDLATGMESCQIDTTLPILIIPHFEVADGIECSIRMQDAQFWAKRTDGATFVVDSAGD